MAFIDDMRSPCEQVRAMTTLDIQPCCSMDSALEAAAAFGKPVVGEATGQPMMGNKSSTVCVHKTSSGSIMPDVYAAISLFKSPANMLKQSTDLFTPKSSQSERDRRSRVSCRCALLSTVSAAMILGVVIMFVPMAIYTAIVQESTEHLFEHAVSSQKLLVDYIDPNNTVSLNPTVVLARANELVHEIEVFNQRTHSTQYQMRLLSTCIFLLTVVAVGICATLLGYGISRQLGHLHSMTKLMRRLRNLDIAYGSADFRDLELGMRSSITEIRDLQDSFCSLSHAIDRFSHFVPASVVQRIVMREQKASRLHVDRRVVTIMFSDIADFTTIIERLSKQNPKRLMFVLTRYFEVMNSIIEKYEGTVGEILGDGLVAFWNTPLEIADHATKACVAAIAQQHAIRALNIEFARLGYTKLKIRIGIHTGSVLTGNIGSFTKMKFGCIGDAMNLAARLEGLCKRYGVGVICSADTYQEVDPDEGIVPRRLDLVQVKGKTVPTEIYEIIGCEKKGGGKSATSHRYAIPPVMETVMEAVGQSDDMHMQAINQFEVAMRWGCTMEGEDSGDVCAKDSGDNLSLSGCEAVVSDRVDPKRREQAAKYEDALTAYQTAQFGLARAITSDLLQEDPEDTATQRLHSKSSICSENASEVDLATWNGVEVMLEK